MKIVIAGSGDTGVHLAKTLSSENQDVVLMGTDNTLLASLDSECNILTHAADALDLDALKAVGTAGADLFVAVTPHQSVNILSCQLAKALGAARCVARVTDGRLVTDDPCVRSALTAVDDIILPEMLVAEDLCAYIARSWMISRYDISGSLSLCGLRVAPGSPADGLQLKSLGNEHRRFHVVSVHRANRMFIPRGDDFLLKGDLAYISMHTADESAVAQFCGHTPRRVRNIMIAGAGRITAQLLRKLDTTPCSVTVIDAGHARCRLVAESFRHVTVVNADPRDMAALSEEQLSMMDMFMALTDDAATNIVTCMMARDMGVQKTVAHIEDLQYMAGVDSMKIDKVVNKKLTTSSHIIRSILGRDIKVGMFHTLQDADVAEIEVLPGSRICRGPVRTLSLPQGVTFGGLSRDGKGIIVEGSTQILPGDRLVVVSTQGSILKIRNWFK